MDNCQIRRQYLELIPQLTHVYDLVGAQLRSLPQSDFVVELNFKPYQSVQNKMARDKLNNVSQMSDLVRGRIFFSAKYTFSEMVEVLKKLLGKTIKKADKKDESEYGLQYNGVMHLDLLIDNIKFELQLIPIEFQPYKELLHKIYDMFRSDVELSDAQKNILKNIHNKLYQILDKQAKNNRKSSSSK